MRIYHVNTTSYDEEDFILLTDLTEEQISSVIKPIVEEEREIGDWYDNDTILAALKKEYPRNKIDIIDVEYLSY